MDSTRLASDPEKQTQKSEGRVKTGIMYAAAIKEICNPQGQYVHIWNKMFVISCVFAVSLDPLFFYIPIIDQQNKCLQMDKVLQTVALILRSLTDVIFLLHFICEICDGLKTQTKKKSPPSTSETKLASDTPKTTAPNTQSNGHSNSKVETGEHSGPKSKKRLIGVAQELMPWLSVSIIIDFFALLPIPQLLIVVTSDKMRGFGYLEHKKVMNILLLGQYLPRMYRIHISSKELKRTTGIWVKGLFNFFLYILASHILGAFWYFFSIQREISCWHQTCVNHSIDSAQCINTVYCNGQTTTSRNITFVNEHCPLDTPDNATSSFNFGIFLDSLKNQNTEHIKFGKKFFYSFWWGLRNLSNFGTNLTTSTYVWENLFAILISVIGLLLFLYLIGNVQTFMQMQATKSEEMRKKIKIKKLDIQSWISKNKVPDDIKKEIMKSVKQKLKEHKDADLQNDLYSILPGKTRTSLKRCLCMDAFKTVPMLENMSKKVLEMMCEYLKPVMYNENSFPFRMGDPLDRMLFIIDGTMWTYSGGGGDEAATSPSNISTLLVAKPLGKGEIYGEELLSWASPSITQLPISTKHLKSQTKVEAFALMAKDLATIVSRYELQWENNKGDKSQQVKEDMALSKIETVLVPQFRLTRNKKRHTTSTKRVTLQVGSNNLSTIPPPIN
ncbi:PREDICTED: cyclic [Prunus dulcis]|uniref:PREDICTED: cyclic n=1 Tax=Prunus dulcis TaxID=3755 RepID=A0A5E4EZU4_PRUDU|nr:cyclic nucleotide-gated ion channel 1-like [Prunus dulcis]VVA20942.1 PREDICTED: cyclic [Prunus dulcis]